MKKISFIVPCYNEQESLPIFEKEFGLLTKKFAKKYSYEIILIDDGSRDATCLILEQISERDTHYKVISLTRNFGKEAAVTAGLNLATGDAAIIIDSDLQYPIDKIPEFLSEWEKGAKHVIGLRNSKQTSNIIEKLGSRLFGSIMRRITSQGYNSLALDFRLLDRVIINQFVLLKERHRMVRSLVDWLGYNPVYVNYTEKERVAGTTSFNFNKRFLLAINTFVYQSIIPLHFVFYFGLVITFLSGMIGLFAILEILFAHNFLGLSGPFILGIFNTFLIGIVLIFLGLVAFYIAAIREEIIARPLYVIGDTKNF